MKRIAIIPTLFTLGNGVCGFIAIALTSKIGPDNPDSNAYYFTASACLILAAMVFDSLDGYVARLSRSASEFGGQLDSLCDVISFGVAPGLLLLRLGRDWDMVAIRQIVGGVAGLYVVCAILRLARFNIENSPDPAAHKRFKGLPSPAAAGCIASLAIVRGRLDSEYLSQLNELFRDCARMGCLFGGFVVALLMVSKIPYPRVSKQFLRGRRHFSHLVQIILALFVIAATRELAVALMFWTYALIFPFRHLILRMIRGHAVPATAPGLNDGLHR